ncbi:hypothetical protein CN383_00120 [Priestia megaterium]|uniref:hypothetical protein n=1 Tax=Priestia megaterium TaxID=1404 RepID=UPI000BF74E95|nr:hypothetical protein [Priestia megaterium]PFB07259.1 hypothetical protein CN383_00120 [Priestia megaterium]
MATKKQEVEVKTEAQLVEEARLEALKPKFAEGYAPVRVKVKEGQIVARGVGEYHGAGSVFDITEGEAKQYSNLFEIVPDQTPLESNYVRPKAGDAVVMLNTTGFNGTYRR